MFLPIPGGHCDHTCSRTGWLTIEITRKMESEFEEFYILSNPPLLPHAVSEVIRQAQRDLDVSVNTSSRPRITPG
jgi:hypothetical protein